MLLPNHATCSSFACYGGCFWKGLELVGIKCWWTNQQVIKIDHRDEKMMLLECQSQSQCHRKPLCREYIFFFFNASKTHTEKKKKLHRINKVKYKTQQQKKQIANLHTYMAIYLQILKYVTSVLIPYISVLSMISN